MIKKFIARVFGKRGTGAGAGSGKVGEPHILGKGEHGIARDQISNAALRVCDGLQDEGYQAFVVGGAVRDLLLGRHPKDFDVATDATPEQVRGVFRRSRIIGRRFRLVHVMFGQETIEVSTFRANHGDAGAAVPPTGDGPRRDTAGNDNARADEHGRLLRDNVFGDQQQDAIRRDFTMNALFYDPAREEVWDYVEGVADIRKKKVVMIGDPTARYREDPVRMLRAARLAGKLGFSIEPKTEKPIAELAPLLANVPEARIFDEMLKLLFSGHALVCIEKLHALGLHKMVLPSLGPLLSNADSRPFATLALTRTDERIAADKGVSPAFLFAALFWHPMKTLWQKHEAAGMRPAQAMHEAMDEVLEDQRRHLAVPRRLDAGIKELWLSQPRFLQRSKVKAYRNLSHPRFRACYDFFELRASAGDADPEVAHWWEKFQFAEEDEREAMLLPDDEPRKKRRRRGKKSGAPPSAGPENGANMGPDHDPHPE